MQDYKVQLESYSGPLDLLLYLIRRDEIDVYDIPISRVLEQYLEYVRLLEELDPDTAGEFLVMAATLMEIKSRLLLPKPPPESQEADDWLDPRADLVRQLLAYRSFRDAAEGLNRMAAIRSQRFGRKPPDLADEENQVDLEDLQIWDLMAVFNKLLAAIGKGGLSTRFSTTTRRSRCTPPTFWTGWNVKAAPCISSGSSKVARGAR